MKAARKRPGKKSKPPGATYRVLECRNWPELIQNIQKAKEIVKVGDEACWFRGCTDRGHSLLPSLMRCTQGLSRSDHDQFEQDVFFEFQARAAQLRSYSLTDWDYLFYSRHYKAPARVLDWTESLAVALFFATSAQTSADIPGLWILDPTGLNVQSWGKKEIILPKYLGYDEDEDEFWDFSELLVTTGPWGWEAPVAVYPLQTNERVSAQRGWFTIHGDNREGLEKQVPNCVVRLDLTERCKQDVVDMLSLLGIDGYHVYPDLENLALSIGAQRKAWADTKRKSAMKR